ncbi:MAG: polyprenyl synthetase family protein [Clostridia bacterium]|nr:polyprenyl synthetase family protein [Clostridia bacterium]
MSVLDSLKEDIEQINRLLPREADGELTALLTDSQNYSLSAGGKRIRPLIVLLTARLFGGKRASAMPYALAVELIHTASLIHDDMPEIDNDDKRRGKPTNHKVFGQSTALLAGDGLFIDAFSLLSSNAELDDAANIRAVRILSRAAGSLGLVGGEFIDVLCEGRKIDIETLRTMHSKKTGALILAAARLGAVAAGVAEEDERYLDISEFARGIGLAFQIVDDALDRVASEDALGKPIGSDERCKKATYLSFYTPEQALRLSEEITEEAISYIEKYEGSETLISLARELAYRRS